MIVDTDKKMHQTRRYRAMTTIETDSIRSLYTPDTFFDEWSPCVTTAWSRVIDSKKHILQSEWKHLGNESSYVFEVPEKAIHGSLFLDQGRAYFRDYHKGRLSKMNIRSSLKSMNILGAFWVPHQQRIIIHDAFMEEGQSICESVFTSRWKSLARILEHVEQDIVMQGCSIEVIQHEETNALTSQTVTIVLQPNTGLATVIHSIPAELINIAQQKPSPVLLEAVPESQQKIIVQMLPTESEKPINVSTKKNGNMYIKKHSRLSGPEAYQLFCDEDELGMPCIQSLSMIVAVRNKLKESDIVNVVANWNKNLDAYEIVKVM